MRSSGGEEELAGGHRAPAPVDAPPEGAGERVRIALALSGVEVEPPVADFMRWLKNQRDLAVELIVVEEAVPRTRGSATRLALTRVANFLRLDPRALLPTRGGTERATDQFPVAWVGLAGERWQPGGEADSPPWEIVLDLGAAVAEGNWANVAGSQCLTVRIGGRTLSDPWCATWDLHDGSPTTEIEVRLSKGGISTPIRCARFSTEWNPARQRELMQRRALRLFGECLLEVMRHDGADGEPEAPGRDVPSAEEGPTVGQAIRWAVRSAGFAGRTVAQRVAPQFTAPLTDWRVAVGAGTWDALLDKDPPKLTDLPNPPGRWLADPLFCSWQGRRGLFVEDFDQDAGVGRVSWVPQLGDSFGQPEVVLAEPFHMSFPWTFDYEGQLYMLPESWAAAELRLYRCVRFPSEWTLEATWFRGEHWADPVVTEHEGRWYLLVNRDPDGMVDAGAELVVFHATDPVSGRWQPVAGNPQVEDAGRARNGGWWRAEGRPLRTSQTRGFLTYGNGCVINEVTALSARGYRERPIADLTGLLGEGTSGPHTVSVSDGWFAVDYRRHRRWSDKGRNTGTG